MAIVQSAVLKFERQRNEVKRKPNFKIQAYEKGKRTFQWTSAFGYFCRNEKSNRRKHEKLKTNFKQKYLDKLH